MRFAYFLFMICLFFPVSAFAQETALIMPAVPWETPAPKAVPEIKPKKLSLSDLEKIVEDANTTEEEMEEARPSTIEAVYSDRIVDELQQFGYDLFNDADRPDNTIPAGIVQDDYILSSGDTLRIILRGQFNLQQEIEVDNQGLLIVENLTPITAAGRSIKDVQNDLQREVQSLHNTQIYVSLAGVRQIGILVVGHVKKPGRKYLTGFHSVLDALNAAGGIHKTGSLRRVKLVRKGKTYLIDLYQLLMANAVNADRVLKDGDRIIVPPLGPTMAITGNVKRPGIYEIVKGEKLSLHQALGLAGGVLTPGQNRYMKLEYTSDGEETVQDISAPKTRIFGDGSILMVAQSEQKQASAVTLSGHTRQPGTHDLKKSKTLADLINNEKVLGRDIYPLIGVIERRDSKQLTKKLVAFSPYQVLQKEYNASLNDGDTVRLFSSAEIRNLDNSAPLLHEASMNVEENKDLIDDPLLSAFLKERAAFVRGAVRQEGAYPVTAGTTLESILAVAGGISLEANQENIELTSHKSGRKVINLAEDDPAFVSINPGDTVRVNQKFHKIADQSVMIMGEVNHPGRYDLMSGDTLSKLVQRAGGLTPQSYPDGAIFSRASERKAEENRYKAQAQDLSMKLAASLQQTDDDKKPNMAQVQTTESLIAQLKNATAIGRITVEADPATLSVYPEQDILLESGDRIYIPKRPLTVRVAGEVLSPAALQFREGKDPAEYLREAGGTTYYADKDRTFVIYPDGSAQPLHVNMWNHRSAFIPPGSTIIVPRDPKPFDFLESAERVSQILANLAISGLYVEAIGDDD
jgi:protein involved in polysaccharide export with SLBB domain